MKKVIYSVTLLFTMIFSVGILTGQNKIQGDSLIMIETSDGNIFVGKLISEDSLILIISTHELAEVRILKTKIVRREMVPASRVVGNEVWLENPQAARYFYAPNGYGLHKGEGYYQNTWVLFNQLSVGLTDNISIGVGLVPLFLFGEGGVTPFWITPKVSIPLVDEKVNLGMGVLAGTILGESESGFGILYSVATFGSKDVNATLGLGYGYIGGELAETPTINFSAMVRGGRRFYFITENYYISEEVTLLSAGGRSLINRAAIDYGLVMPITDGLIAVPWLGVTIPFYSKARKSAS